MRVGYCRESFRCRHDAVFLGILRRNSTATGHRRSGSRGEAHNLAYCSRMGEPFFALALLAHLAGQGLVAFGVGRLSASLAAVILCLEGVGAMTVGALFYAESRDVWDLSAVILIVSGIALAKRDAG